MTFPIRYVVGDATRPPSNEGGIRILPHVCNNLGGWGAGYVVALSRRWPEPERRYREWSALCAEEGKKLPLGETQIIRVSDEHGELFVANMVAQDGYRTRDRRVAVDSGALNSCLGWLGEWAVNMDFIRQGFDTGRRRWHGRRPPPAVFHMPRIGCGLGGGSWSEIEGMIQKHLGVRQVVVYDLPEERRNEQTDELIRVIEENS